MSADNSTGKGLSARVIAHGGRYLVIRRTPEGVSTTVRDCPTRESADRECLHLNREFAAQQVHEHGDRRRARNHFQEDGVL